MKEESIELQMKTIDTTDGSIVEDYRSLTSVIYTNYGKKKNLKPNHRYIFRIRKCQLRKEKWSAVCIFVCMKCVCVFDWILYTSFSVYHIFHLTLIISFVYDSLESHLDVR